MDGIRSLRFNDGTTWRFRTQDGLLVSQADRTGNTLGITRDSQGRVTALSEPAGRQLTVSYSGSSLRIDRITDPLGREVRYTYDAQGRLETVTDPAGGVTRYTYDSNHRLLTITDPRGIPFLTNEYDGANRVSRQTQADGGVWTFAYTMAGGSITATTVTDPRGNRTLSRFNADRYLVSRTDALGQTTTFDRQPGTNLLLSTTDSLGRTTKFTYDGNGNVTSITDPQGNVRTFTYDPTFNKVTSITDPLGNVTTFMYDEQGNLLRTIDPLGNVTQFGYNQVGQPVSTTDAMGNVTQFTYTAQGDLERVTDPLGNTTTREYDSVSRLVRQIDPRGKPTTFTYDALNRPLGVVDALGGTTAFSYDPNGNLLSIADPRGNGITYEYDNMDRLIHRTDPLGRADTFTYDRNGNLMSTTDRKGQTTTFTYDALDRPVRSEFADGSVVTRTYDAVSRVLQADDTADPHRPITREYDFLDRLIAETTALGAARYQYDALDRRTQMTVSGQAPVIYVSDANSRLRTISQAPLNAVDVQYDALNRRTQLIVPNGVSTEYQYDAASRLTALLYRSSLGFLGDLTYQYDSAGNRIGIGGSLAQTLLPAPVPSGAYDAANQQLAFGPIIMTFDANGNLISHTEEGSTTTYAWDARDRLIAVSGPGGLTTFAYDAAQRRAQKVVDGQAIAYQHDGLDIVREVGGGVEAGYLHGPNLDEPLIRNASEHYLLDALGSVIALADPTGTLTTRYAYDAFGRSVAAGPASTNPFQYTARELNGTGLYYYRARYYAPALARFIQPDRIGFGGGFNLYAYVGGNPINYRDPFGLFRISIQDIGGRTGPTYGATIRVEGDDGKTSITVPGSSWPNPGDVSPGIQEGTFDARYSKTGHKVGTQPGVRLEEGGRVPTLGPNPRQENQNFADGINIHCGFSKTSRGSWGCITIRPDYCESVWKILKEGEKGKVTISRRERPGF